MKNPYRLPHYPNNADYTTNAASYYDDLARKNELLKHLAYRIWEYDKELAKRFAQWDQMLQDGLAAEVIKQLEKWLADGTLAEIFGNFFDDLNSRVDELREQLTASTLYLQGNKQAVIRSSTTPDREELQLYSTGDAFDVNSDGAGIHLYGNGDSQHSGNFTVLTGQDNAGDARLTVTGGSNNPASDGYRENNDTRVTIGNGIWDFVDDQEDTAMLNLKNPEGRPAICFFQTSSDEGELSVPDGERFSIGHWDGIRFIERFAVDSAGRSIVTNGPNGQEALAVDGMHTPHMQELGDSQSTSSMMLANYSLDNESAANIYLMKSPSNSVGTHAPVRTGDVLGEVMFGGSDGNAFHSGASVSASASESNWTGASKPTRLQLKTTPEGEDSPKTQMTVNSDGSISAGTDNTQTFGTPSYRWSEIYSGTGTISTSDRNSKQQISPITDAVLDAWSEMEYSMYKFNDAVEEKGDKARFHFGVIAQQIDEVFNNHNLNAMEYGLLCIDLLEDGTKRWGVRTDECLMLEAALMRRELKKLKG